VRAVFSVIVFLHFDRSEYAESYFRECARVLEAGRIGDDQLPLYTWPRTQGIYEARVIRGLGAYMSLRRWKGAYHRFLLRGRSGALFMRASVNDTRVIRSALVRGRPGLQAD